MQEDNKKTITALKKARSLLGRVIAMAENHEYCIDLLQQNLAVIGLLKAANGRILEGHLNSCFATAMRGTNEKRKKKMIEEILSINKLNK
ncbi:MAG: metal-sensing transcriptional repressor [Parcubacteria group bacterium]